MFKKKSSDFHIVVTLKRVITRAKGDNYKYANIHAGDRFFVCFVLQIKEESLQRLRFFFLAFCKA